MLYYALMNNETRYYLITAAIFLFGLGCFLLSGLIRVKKDEECVLYRGRETVKVLKAGWHYAFPLLYHESIHYLVAATEYEVEPAPGQTIAIEAQIIDVRLLDASSATINEIVRRALTEINAEPEESLGKALADIGVRFIAIK